MSDVENKSVDVAIAVMTEQITQVALGIQRIERIMSEQAQSLGEIPVIKRDVAEINDKVERAFKAIKSLNDSAVAQAQLNATMGTYQKIFGSVASGALIVAMALAGWSWTQLDALHKTDSEISLRVNTLEVRSAEADRFTQQGYVRK